MTKQLFRGGKCIIRRFGNYVNTVDNTELAIRTFLLKNCPPNWDYQNENELRPAKIPNTFRTRDILKIAKEKKFTFEVI